MRFGDAIPSGSRLRKPGAPGAKCPTMVRYLLHLSDLMFNTDDDAAQHRHEFCGFEVPMPILWGLIMLRSFNRWWTVPELVGHNMWCYPSPGPDDAAYKPVNETARNDDVYVKVWICTPADRELPAEELCSFMSIHRGEVMESTDSGGDFETDAEGEDLTSSFSSDYPMTSASQPINISSTPRRRERGVSESVSRSSVASSHYNVSEASYRPAVENYPQYQTPSQRNFTMPGPSYPTEGDIRNSFQNPRYFGSRQQSGVIFDDDMDNSDPPANQSLEDRYMRRVLPRHHLYLDLSEDEYKDLKRNGSGIPLVPPMPVSETTAERPSRHRRHYESAQYSNHPREISSSRHRRPREDDYVRRQWQQQHEQHEQTEDFLMDDLENDDAGSGFFPPSVRQYDTSVLSTTPRQRRSRHDTAGTSYTGQHDTIIPSSVDSRSPTSPQYRLDSRPLSFETARFNRTSGFDDQQDLDADWQYINQVPEPRRTRHAEDAAGSSNYRPSDRDRPSRQPRSGHSSRPDGRPDERSERWPDDSRQDYSSSHRSSYWPRN
ncbi:hypothetical protein ABW21_db0205790 [Orbilia brochopaga]|nr:hypothetical protein ABW21_db0205790 [Drechslerella brochopaga]